jgi:hypothetical protein
MGVPPNLLERLARFEEAVLRAERVARQARGWLAVAAVALAGLLAVAAARLALGR